MGESMKVAIPFSVVLSLFAAGLTGSLAVGLIVGAVLMIGIICAVNSSAKTEKEEKEKNAPREFYEECKKQGVTNLKDTYQREKAILIAQRAGCKFTDIEQFYSEVKTKMDAKNASEEQARKNTELRKLREAEETQKAELKRFANYQGRNKRIAILEYQQAEYRKKAKEMKDAMEHSYYASQESEINSGVAGGIASGLFGGVAGVAAYIDAENENARIREENQANLASMRPLFERLMDREFEYEKAANKLQTSIDDAKIKLVSPMPGNEVFKYLSVSAKKVEISQTGAFTIEAIVEVNAEKQALMIGNANGVIDGVIVAEMYQDNQKIGSALMVLPTYGVKDKAIIMGLSTCHADSIKPYEFKFRPYHLWIMEE